MNKKNNIITTIVLVVFVLLCLITLLMGYRPVKGENLTVDYDGINVIVQIFGALGSFIAIVLILYQVKKQSDDTNKQIRNDKIENHRPFLVIEEIKEEAHSVFGYDIKPQSIKDADKVAFNIMVRNIGYGIARDVHLVDPALNDNISAIQFSDYSFTTSLFPRTMNYTSLNNGISLDTSLDLSIQSSGALRVNIMYNKNDEKKTILLPIQLIYYDLYRTQYNSYIFIKVNTETGKVEVENDSTTGMTFSEANGKSFVKGVNKALSFISSSSSLLNHQDSLSKDIKDLIKDEVEE